MANDEQEDKSALPKDDSIAVTAPSTVGLAPEDRPTQHGVDTYLPKPRGERKGIALCLSGGGFRAALFHLGALRRLNELGLLSQVTDISSVSGGSVISAHLAQRIQPWPQPGQVVDNWDEKVAKPFYDFASHNIRTPALLARLRHLSDPSSVILKLADIYKRKLTGMRITDLPARPNFIFCATDMVFGVNWTFERASMGDYIAGTMSPPPDWPLAWAVAASSCFPPVFDPFPLNLRPDQLKGGSASPDEKKLIKDIHLTDGGVYDNMGLEPVWKRAKTVLVSDGGAKFSYEWERTFPGRVLRYQSIQGNQSLSLRKRWLMSNFMTAKSDNNSGGTFGMEGAYWGIGSATSHYTAKNDPPPPGYKETTVSQRIAPIRTDFDAFTEAEIAVLENHGYYLADAAISRHLAHLITTKVDLKPPHGGDYMSDAWVDAHLRDTGTRILGRPFPF